jgi:hypothetical protein
MKGHLKCKEQNNEDKGYLKLMGDTKREPFEKKTLKPLGSKTQSQPPTKPPPPKKGGAHEDFPTIVGTCLIVVVIVKEFIVKQQHFLNQDVMLQSLFSSFYLLI